jgi:hypothetical protein
MCDWARETLNPRWIQFGRTTIWAGNGHWDALLGDTTTEARSERDKAGGVIRRTMRPHAWDKGGKDVTSV